MQMSRKYEKHWGRIQSYTLRVKATWYICCAPSHGDGLGIRALLGQKNQEEQLAAGHHGVPLLVHDGKYFFGQDKFDEFLSFMTAKGIQRR